MGDPKRFDLFAGLVSSRAPKAAQIADVAGGKGYLRAAMGDRGFSRVTTWDKRASKIPGNQVYRYFDWATAPKYDLVVGMHPDEATDHIICYAGKHRVPAFICPCCVKPSAVTFWGGYKFKHWTTHLLQLIKERDLKYELHHLPMQGKNLVIEIIP